MDDLPTIPIALRVHLAHAVLQGVADSGGADVLHIKGPAVSTTIRPPGHLSADADLLVRPSHLERLGEAMAAHGWECVKRLRNDLVQHSEGWYHPQLGQADVHVRFPGIRLNAEEAFDLLWRPRGTVEIAHRRCVVPSQVAQRLILLLHAARSPQAHVDDVARAWHDAPESQRVAVLALTRALDAEVALAVVVGGLDDFRGRPEHALWQQYADGTVTSEGFGRLRAQVQATRGRPLIDRIRVVVYAIGVVVRVRQRLTTQFGRRPSRRETTAEYAVLFRRAADVLRALQARRR